MVKFVLKKDEVSLYRLVIIVISSIIILIINHNTIFSYFYTVIVFCFINTFLESKLKNENFLYFHCYLFVCLGIYLIQLYNLPKYMGLTGPEGGIGTDDVRYFAQITNSNISYSPSVVWDNSHPHSFSAFLTFLYPFFIKTPLNVLYINLLGISFLPYFTYKFSYSLIKQEKVSVLAKRLILFCPFTMANGLILMRDIWIVTFLIAGLYFFIEKKYIGLLICISLIAYIRFGSMAFMGTGILILLKYKINKLFPSIVISNIIYLIIFIIAIIAFFLLLPFLVSISSGKLSTSIFREEFIGILSRMDGDAFIVKLMRLPGIIRTPLLTIFFFFSPFFKFQFYTKGIFDIRTIMISFLTPAIFFFYWNNIIKSSLYGLIHKTNVRLIVSIAVVFSLVLGIISLQARHKTVLMPFLYILMAIGCFLPPKKYKFVSMFCALCVIMIQIVFL